jgi:hypothetical protein
MGFVALIVMNAHAHNSDILICISHSVLGAPKQLAYIYHAGSNKSALYSINPPQHYSALRKFCLVYQNQLGPIEHPIENILFDIQIRCIAPDRQLLFQNMAPFGYLHTLSDRDHPATSKVIITNYTINSG